MMTGKSGSDKAFVFSISSPIIPAGQELTTITAFGLGFLSLIFKTVSSSFSVPPNTISSSVISVDTMLGTMEEGSMTPLSNSLRLPEELTPWYERYIQLLGE